MKAKPQQPPAPTDVVLDATFATATEQFTDKYNLTTTVAHPQTKVVSIIVNTKPHAWAEKKISFEQVVELAFPGQPYDPAGTLVEYSRGHGPDHSLRPGKDVGVKDGMVFDVEPANRSGRADRSPSG
jgi:hypothetical protein